MARAFAFPVAIEIDNGTILYSFQAAIVPTGNESFIPHAKGFTITPNFGLLEEGINNQIRDAIKDYCSNTLGINIPNSSVMWHQLQKPLL